MYLWKPITFTCAFCRLFSLSRNTTTCQIKPHQNCNQNLNSFQWEIQSNIFTFFSCHDDTYIEFDFNYSTIVGMCPERGVFNNIMWLHCMSDNTQTASHKKNFIFCVKWLNSRYILSSICIILDNENSV